MYLGSTKIEKLYLGNIQIDKAYLGNTLVFSQGQDTGIQLPISKWLVSTGNSYINTGYYPNPNTEVEYCFYVTNILQYGPHIASSNNFYSPFYRTYNSKVFTARCGGSGSFSYTVQTNKEYTVQAFRGNDDIIFNGVNIGSRVAGNTNSTTPLYLFTYGGEPSSSSYKMSGALKYYKIYENGVLIHNFQPNEVNGIAGMLDTITNTFYPSETSTQFTIREVVDSDGLICHWNSADAVSNGAWVDRVNSLKLTLGGTAARTTDGYRLNNLSKPRAAWALFDSTQNSTLNSLVDKEFTCYIKCAIKFGQTNKSACLADFGALGSSASGISLLSKIGQNGSIGINSKCNGNSGTGFSSGDRSPTGGPTFELNTYVPVIVKCGCHLLSNGKQEVYLEANTLRAYSIKDTPVAVNFSGCGGTTNQAFGLGITYLNSDSLANQYASSYLSDVIYDKVLIYNKYK